MNAAKLLRQQTLAFEPETKIYQESIKLMQMMNSSLQRKDNMEFIYNKLQRLPYFNQFIERFFKARNRENILTFCSHLRMEHFTAGDIIFEEGDLSNDKLYIIYSGSVLLFRRKPVEQLQEELQKDYEMRQRMQTEQEISPTKLASPLSIKYIVKMKFLVNKLVRKVRKSLSNEERHNLEFHFGPVLRTMIRGEGFGEKAILENTTRTLTIAASSGHLFLVVLKKENFAELQSQFEQEMKEKKKIIFSVFQSLKDEYSTARLETIFYSFESMEYDRNQIVYNEEETGQNFFIIQRGEVTLSKKFIDYTKVPPLEQLIYVCTLGPGHLFGEEILTNKIGIYESTASVSISNTTLMIVSYNEFHTKFPEECRQQILSGYKMKSTNRQEMFHRMLENRIKTSQNSVIQIDTYQQVLHLNNLDKQYPKDNLKFQKIQNDLRQGNSFYSKKDLFPNKLQISNDLQQKFWNPTLTQYCINTIVQNQSNNHEKNTTSRKTLSSQFAGPDQFDFGKEKPEDLKKQQHMFRLKRNTKKLPDNYITQNEFTFPAKIKQEYSRIMRKKKNLIKIDPIYKNSLIISTSPNDFSSILSTNKSDTFHKIQYKFLKDSFQSYRQETFPSEVNQLFVGIKTKLEEQSSRYVKKNFRSYQNLLNQAK